MIADKWPWSWEEEEEWGEEVRREEIGWLDGLIDHMVDNGLAGHSYDPLEPVEERPDEITPVR